MISVGRIMIAISKFDQHHANLRGICLKVLAKVTTFLIFLTRLRRSQMSIHCCTPSHVEYLPRRLRIRNRFQILKKLTATHRRLPVILLNLVDCAVPI